MYTIVRYAVLYKPRDTSYLDSAHGYDRPKGQMKGMCQLHLIERLLTLYGYLQWMYGIVHGQFTSPPRMRNLDEGFCWSLRSVTVGVPTSLSESTFQQRQEKIHSRHEFGKHQQPWQEGSRGACLHVPHWTSRRRLALIVVGEACYLLRGCRSNWAPVDEGASEPTL